MRKSRLEASNTRSEIVRNAAVEFRRNGIQAVSLGDVMSATGLTQGGFYKHFSSKDQLVSEACAVGLQDLSQRLLNALRENASLSVMEVVTSIYLTPQHRDNPGEGCTFAALGSELVHCGEETRRVVTDGLLKLVDIVAAQFSEMPTAQAQEKAFACVSMLVGALTIARVVPDSELSSKVLRSATAELTMAGN